MGWDDSDDDEWEKADVPQPGAGKGSQEVWSDDEDEKDAVAARAKEAADKATAEKAAAEKPAAGTAAAAPSSAKKPAAAPAPAPAPAAAPPAESAASAAPVDAGAGQPPRTDKDFERLAGLIHAQLKQYEGGKGHLALVKALCKASMENMSLDDSKQMAATMTAIFNGKVTKEREKDKGKKKVTKKGQMTQGKQTGHDTGGRGGYDEDYDDY